MDTAIATLTSAGLRTQTGHQVLHSLTATIPHGAFRWLLGPSGAGKTSLLRLLSLTVRPTSGDLHVLGTRIATAPRASLPALRRRIGMVFQDLRLLDHLSAFENVALPLHLAGQPPATIHADVTEMLAWLGLAHHAETRPAALSAGEQQRIAIARAVIARPALLLADEPTSHLDPAGAACVLQLLAELNRLGTTIVVATHTPGLAAAHPAPTLYLEGGHLHEAPPRERKVPPREREAPPRERNLPPGERHHPPPERGPNSHPAAARHADAA